MAFRQPRVPEYRESEGVNRYIRPLILFLKEFTMAAWEANNQRIRDIETVKRTIEELPEMPEIPEIPEIHYPVTSVNGKTGDVKLDIDDVGGLRPVEKTEEMTVPVGADENRQLFTRDTSRAELLIRVTGIEGQTPHITIKNEETGSIEAEFDYEQETSVFLPVAMRCRIEGSALAGYSNPKAQVVTILGGQRTQAELAYIYGLRYGYRRRKAEASPDARIEYLYDAVGMTPMTMDLSAGTPNYGSWETFIDELCRPVMLRYDGTVDYELDHSDQTLKLNGTTSDVANTAYEGNAMVEFRKWKWVHRSEDDEYEYVIFSDVQMDETYHAYAHTNEAGVVQDAFYWGMYVATWSNSRLRSLGTGSHDYGITRDKEMGYAKVNGEGWNIIYKSGWDFIADILTLISKNDNSQAIFGNGRSGVSGTVGAGQLTKKPAFCGYSNTSSSVKVLYLENTWANTWDSLAGVILKGTFRVNMTPPYNTDGTGYYDTGIVPVNTGSGYVNQHSCTDRGGYLPINNAGSATTYICDGTSFFSSTSESNVGFPHVGVRYGLDNRSGARALYCADTAATTDITYSARLSYLKP